MTSDSSIDDMVTKRKQKSFILNFCLLTSEKAIAMKCSPRSFLRQFPAEGNPSAGLSRSFLFPHSCFKAIAILIIFSTSVQGETTDRASNSEPTIESTPSSTSTETSKSCPRDLEGLTTHLIQKIPDYSNRVIQRTQESHQNAKIDTYVITAGRPEIEPLNLPQINYSATTDKTPQQIFFTTLERQYTNNKKIERETYHWLFVTLADSGWYLVTMFSRFGNATKNTPLTPPQESSNGIIGQAVSLWLRDCRHDGNLTDKADKLTVRSHKL
jgi:hypothetical protein